MRAAPRIGESCTVGVGGKFLVDDDTSQIATQSCILDVSNFTPGWSSSPSSHFDSLAPVGEYTYARLYSSTITIHPLRLFAAKSICHPHRHFLFYSFVCVRIAFGPITPNRFLSEGHQGEFRHQARLHHHRPQRDCHSGASVYSLSIWIPCAMLW